MNDGEARIAAEIAALSDTHLLLRVLEEDEITTAERDAFREMRALILTGDRERLSKKQRSWAEEVLRRCTPVLASDVPRGREVATPAVLQNLPKRPPPRRREDS